jgi:DNA helicase-2/ATP-dependent DNA helicase PcrA
MSTTIQRFIVGPPGTGKTERAKQYVQQLSTTMNPKDIALVSFTNAAAETLVSRGIPVPKTNIGTLHSFAFRAIGAKKDQVAESHIDDWNNLYPNYAISGTNAKISPEYDAPGDGPANEIPGDEILNRYNILRAKMTDRSVWRTEVQNFADKWEGWKNENDYIDFTDMIDLANQTVRDFPGQPRVIIADEAQDFAPLEMELLKKWSHTADIINWIGDPDQILYEFKGVEPSSFSQFDPTLKTVLSQSWRVPKSAHALAMKWINRIPGREPVSYLPTEREGRVIKVKGATWKQPEKLVKIIEASIANGKDVMIMASCAYMLAPMIKVLREAAIPFHNPNRRSRGDWNPLDGGGLNGSARLLAFLRPDNAVWGDQARFWTVEDVKAWVAVLESAGIMFRGSKTWIENLEPDKEISLNTFLFWFEEAALESAVNLDLNWFKSHLLKAKQRGFDFPLAIAQKHGGAKLREQRQVKIGTIHSFKGDQAATCIIFPDLSDRGMREWESTSTRNRILRQFYVALTRTSDDLVITEEASGSYVKLV